MLESENSRLRSVMTPQHGTRFRHAVRPAKAVARSGFGPQCGLRPNPLAPTTVRSALSLAVGLFLALTAAQAVRADPLLTYPLRIAGHGLRAELANTEETRLRGLMFRKSLPENHGMIFIYTEAGPQAMWMKNTLIPLSVAFVDSEGRILNIADMEPHSERSSSGATTSCTQTRRPCSTMSRCTEAVHP